MKIVLEVDELDYQAIQTEFAKRQGQRRPLPEGESDLAGAMVAEAIRDLDEYRALWEVQNEIR